MEVKKLTEDERCLLMKYDYIKVKKENITLADYRPIMQALDQLHANDYVHSDVRFDNIVICSDGQSKVIDFDLAEKVGVPYPDGYNSTLRERHPDATAGSPRQICHDRYSLMYIIRTKLQCSVKEDESKTLEQLYFQNNTVQ